MGTYLDRSFPALDPDSQRLRGDSEPARRGVLRELNALLADSHGTAAAYGVAVLPDLIVDGAVSLSAARAGDGDP